MRWEFELLCFAWLRLHAGRGSAIQNKHAEEAKHNFKLPALL